MTESSKLLNELSAQIVAAYVSNNTVPVSDVASLISSVQRALGQLGKPAAASEAETELRPAVPVKKSVTPEYVFCLECGAKMKMLKRHLSTDHGLTPLEYRAKWRLPADYPMTAPAYSEQRTALAKTLGLGRKSTRGADADGGRGVGRRR